MTAMHILDRANGLELKPEWRDSKGRLPAEIQILSESTKRIVRYYESYNIDPAKLVAEEGIII